MNQILWDTSFNLHVQYNKLIECPTQKTALSLNYVLIIVVRFIIWNKHHPSKHRKTMSKSVVANPDAQQEHPNKTTHAP